MNLTASFRRLRFSRSVIALVAVVAAFAIVNLVQAGIRPNIKFEGEAGASLSNASVVSDSTASNGSYVRFNQPATSCPAGQVGTPPNCVSASSALTVNAANTVRPFDRKMKGISLANWTFTKGWGKPFVGEIQNLQQAIVMIDPGLIRYAGGLWANYVGFDRNVQRTAYTEWTSGGRTYYFHYGTDELASLDAFAKSVDSDVMIQVNISNNDPAMWADFVRYAKEQNFTSFKYYELGNELDLETAEESSTALTPAQYGSRVAAYQQAMLAVDPNIKIVGGVPAAASDIVRTDWLSNGNSVSQYLTQAVAAARGAGRDLGAASFHWYQTSGSVTPENVSQWSWGIPSSSGEFWRMGYSREWASLVGPWIRSAGLQGYNNVPLGISELGVNSSDGITANSNHLAALWYSDVLGRLAYNGIDWVTQWNSYAAAGEHFSLLYPNSDQTTTPTIHARPSYYAYLMYSMYFGNQLVQSGSYDETKISIWASRDTNEPNKLKLRITNFTGGAINVPIALSGFTATSGDAYALTSSNPLDMSEASATSAASTNINGVKVDGSNVVNAVTTIQPTAVTVNGTSFTHNIPAYSSVAIVLNGTF